MNLSPKTRRALWIAAAILFAAGSGWIQYQVKVNVQGGGGKRSGSVAEMGNVKKGMIAPDFTLKDLGQTNVTLSQLRGQKVVLMDFWATWCMPCKMAMVGLQEMQDKFKGRDFEILSIDQQEQAEQVSHFIKAKNYGFHVLLDSEGDVGNLYGVRGIPTLILVDKKGVIQWLQVGNSGDEQALTREVERLLKE